MPESKSFPLSLLKLARPHQWSKNVFVLFGPFYAAAEGKIISWPGVVAALIAFSFASSSCYVVNDIKDRDADRVHPRKRRRPIASGAVTVSAAGMFAAALLVGGVVAAASPALRPGAGPGLLLLAAVLVYVLNVTVYSLSLKHIPIIDVMSLASGFVLRVLGGCAAAGVTPSSWLLNSTFFLAMFLAFGKRLGERRTMAAASPEDAAALGASRRVQLSYTDDLLRMAVVVTAVATLITYAGYVQSQEVHYTRGFNLLWLTMLPPTYAMFRCILLLERGRFDDPTELATRDHPFQAAVGVFGLLMVVLVLWVRTA
ncbi:MAG: UbiA prenyltransferase family protein [Phycisphaerales bacterium]|nr:UbiA prenyltransferase family protein [Phycisphaerales bacterium]